MAVPLSVLFFGTYDERNHPRVRVLRQGLQCGDFDVATANRPLAFNTGDRVGLARKPWRVVWFLVELVKAWIGALRLIPTGASPDIVVVGYLGHFDVLLSKIRFPRSTIVLDHMVGLADTAQDRRMRRWVVALLNIVDAAALSVADIIVCDTNEQRGRLSLRQRQRSVVVPVGAPSEWFAVADTTALDLEPTDHGRPLRIVFVGLYTPLQGTPFMARALAEAIDLGAGLEVVLVGDGQDAPEVKKILKGYDNVRFLDWVEAEELPQFVASYDVCLGIFGTTAKASRVVPNKVYQGLAAGTTVITSNSKCQRETLGGSCLYVETDESSKLANVLYELAKDRSGLHRSSAKQWEPQAVVASLVERLSSSE